MDPDPNDSFGYVENLRNQLIRTLSAHDGRMTRKQWQDATKGYRPQTIRYLAATLIRKDGHYVVARVLPEVNGTTFAHRSGWYVHPDTRNRQAN